MNNDTFNLTTNCGKESNEIDEAIWKWADDFYGFAIAQETKDTLNDLGFRINKVAIPKKVLAEKIDKEIFAFYWGDSRDVLIKLKKELLASEDKHES